MKHIKMKSKEAQLQTTCVRWFRLQYPEYARLLFAVPNGGSRNAIEAHNLKLQGVTAGVSDLILLVPSHPCPFLCIEMKVGRNKQTAAQKAFQQQVETVGGIYVVCYSFEQFAGAVSAYLTPSPEKSSFAGITEAQIQAFLKKQENKH